MYRRIAWSLGHSLNIPQQLREMQSLESSDAQILGLGRGFANMLADSAISDLSNTQHDGSDGDLMKK